MSGILLTYERGQAITSEDVRSAPSGLAVGVVISHDYEGGPVRQCDVVRCCHCDRRWIWQRGSGKLRGKCLICHGITCGPRCSRKCRPVEQLLENLEAGRHPDYTPIRVIVPGGVPT
jgi:hypothetical protein